MILNKKIAQFISISVLVVSASAAHAQRIALVIGNAAYKYEGVLNNPINDARLLANTLKNDLGFDSVQLVENADFRQLNRAVDEFSRKAGGADAAFVYFSGHGQQTLDKQNYLLAVDAQIEQEADLKAGAITSDALVTATEGAKIRLVVLDACRDRPKGAYKTKSGIKGLTRAKDPSINGLLIAYATEDGDVAQDGRSGGNSPYAAALAAELKKRDKPIMAMFDEVMESVVAQTNGAQVPTRSGNLTVKTYLINPVVVMPVVTPVVADAEKEFWDEIKNSRNVKDFVAYKQQYPKGRFVPLADNKIEEYSLINTPAKNTNLAIPVHEQLALNSPNFRMELDSFLKTDKNAIAILENQMKTGSVLAMARLCELSNYSNQSIKEGTMLCKHLANAGIAVGQTNVGIRENLLDAKSAAKWHRKAAEQGYAPAQYELGEIYASGKGVLFQNDKQAVEWFHKAAEQGYVVAQNELGDIYLKGKYGVHQDKNKATEWYRKAAEQGYRLAQLTLGDLLNNEQSVEWYRKAAEHGHGHGQYRLLRMAQEGSEDAIKSLILLTEQKNIIDADVLEQLGDMYALGTRSFKRVDKNKAVFWYCKAAANGHKSTKELLEKLNINCPSPL